jgi:hypothetical protein
VPLSWPALYSLSATSFAGCNETYISFNCEATFDYLTVANHALPAPDVLLLALFGRAAAVFRSPLLGVKQT